MPSFLQSWFLGGLAALAVPLLIHLFFRLRTKRVDLGTIRFLRTVLEENARRRKVMRWFLLFLRLACVALLAVLFARPYFSAAALSGNKELIVLLIDHSASMQLKGDNGRLFDQALSEAKAFVGRTDPNSRVEIALFDHVVRPLGKMEPATQDASSKTSRRDADKNLVQKSPLELLAAIQVEPLLFGATNYGAAFAWARDILLNVTSGPKQLHLWTDLQRSGLDWTDVDPLPSDVQVHLHDLGRPIVNNVAVTEVRTPRSWIRPGETTSVQATIVHGGAFALEEVAIVLELGRDANPGGATAEQPQSQATSTVRSTNFAQLTARISLRQRIKLLPGATVPVDFEVPALEEGLWAGRVTIEYDDDLPFDNRRYFAIASAPAYRVLVIKGEEADNPLLEETYFLEAALRLAEQDETFASNPFAPEIITYGSTTGLPDLSQFDHVVVANVPNMSRPDAQLLGTFVRGGGGVLIFSGDQMTEENCTQLQEAGLTVGQLGPTKVTHDLPWRLDQWDDRHLVFQELNDPQHGDLRQLIFAAYTRIMPHADTKVLAQFQTGDAAVLERPLGKGTVVWVTTSCGRDWSNWSGTRLFLPIVHQLIGYQVGLSAGGHVRSKLVDVERARDTDEIVDDKNPSAVASSAALRSPGIAISERFAEVINVSPRESETEASTPKDFEDRFGIQFVDASGVEAERPELNKEVEFRPDEIWHWVGCLVLCGILLEGFVGNRTTA